MKSVFDAISKFLTRGPLSEKRMHEEYVRWAKVEYGKDWLYHYYRLLEEHPIK